MPLVRVITHLRVGEGRMVRGVVRALSAQVAREFSVPSQQVHALIEDVGADDNVSLDLLVVVQAGATLERTQKLTECTKRLTQILDLRIKSPYTGAVWVVLMPGAFKQCSGNNSRRKGQRPRRP